MSHSGTAILGIGPWPNRYESLFQKGEETKEEEEAKEEKYLKRGNKHMASGWAVDSGGGDGDGIMEKEERAHGLTGSQIESLHTRALKY